MTQANRTTERWASGDSYEPYVGRWSRLVAQEFLEWLAVPAGRRWLDVGCGTGALTSVLLDQARPDSVVGLDASDDFVAWARVQITDHRASFQAGDAQRLPFDASSFDAVVSGLVLNFVADPVVMVNEMARVTHPGGTIGVYVWDYAGEMQLMRAFWDAAKTLNPAAAELDEGGRFPICQPQPLRDLFAGCGLTQVELRSVDVPTVFRDFDDYWSPFLGGQGPAPGYAMSLTEPDRDALKALLREKLPPRPDGSIPLLARAWAVRGVR
jgi:SAM-dependent methyltransferase